MNFKQILKNLKNYKNEWFAEFIVKNNTYIIAEAINRII